MTVKCTSLHYSSSLDIIIQGFPIFFHCSTLLYEMLTLEKPFGSSPGNVIIYQVGKGSVHHLNNLRDGKFKQIIRRCWRGDANSRPSFQRLLSTLEQNVSYVLL